MKYIVTVDTHIGEVGCSYEAEEIKLLKPLQVHTLEEWQDWIKKHISVFPNATYHIYRLTEVKNG